MDLAINVTCLSLKLSALYTLKAKVQRIKGV